MLTSLISLQKANVRKTEEKSLEIVNIEGENLHIFWTTWRISIKFSEKMRLMIRLKVTKNQGFTLPLENTFLEKSQGEKNPSFFRVKGALATLRNLVCLKRETGIHKKRTYKSRCGKIHQDKNFPKNKNLSFHHIWFLW